MVSFIPEKLKNHWKKLQQKVILVKILIKISHNRFHTPEGTLTIAVYKLPQNVVKTTSKLKITIYYCSQVFRSPELDLVRLPHSSGVSSRSIESQFG